MATLGLVRLDVSWPQQQRQKQQPIRQWDNIDSYDTNYDNSTLISMQRILGFISHWAAKRASSRFAASFISSSHLRQNLTFRTYIALPLPVSRWIFGLLWIRVFRRVETQIWKKRIVSHFGPIDYQAHRFLIGKSMDVIQVPIVT